MGKDRDPGDQAQHPQQSSSSRPVTPHNPKMQSARVRLPDGQFKEFELDRGSEGEILFRQVTADLSIEEREYFSLCFYDKAEGSRHWLYNDKKILRQIKGLPWEFSFEVKFYPTTPSTLVDDHARYYLFLQLRRDILTGRLPATSATHALLGSFVAQIEYGDAPSHISDDYEKFITGARLVPDSEGNPEVFKQIAELHRELRGRTTSEAENLYLEHCKQLALYGIHLFPVKDKKGDSVSVGIGAAGINVYKDDQRISHFGWQNINKISYRKTYFTVKLKAGELGKKEQTIDYKLTDYTHAKRVWKCAVEHHTFFRLIQPDDKQKSSLMNFGSQRFRYHGRTQFQTKMASQMFDRPSNVERSPSAMSQPIDSARQVLSPLNYTDNELEQQNFERFRRTLTPKSYTQDDTISNATFAKYSQRSRPNTLLVSTSGRTSQNLDESLSYSPRGQAESPQSSGAAYYLSDRSSLRTPTSAYYPASEHTPYSSGMQSPIDGHYYEGQHRGEYNVELRSKTTGGARRNLFGRSSGTSHDTVRLVSFHEPVDSSQAVPNTYPTNELPEIPIERIVQVYHEGHYDRLSPSRERRADLPLGFGLYTPRNGVTHVDRLEPHNEMDQQPIRFFVDVRHSGASKRNPAKRLSHPGKEDVREKIDPKDYNFSSAATTSEEIHRTELAREIQPANIKQYTRIYHSGDSKTHQPSTSSAPTYRLITHVNPLLVSHRDGRNKETSSNVNATISQREQIVSTKIRRESPDTDRRLRLSVSVDRSGNVTETAEEEQSPSRFETRVIEETITTQIKTTSVPNKKRTKKTKFPPTSQLPTRTALTEVYTSAERNKPETHNVRLVARYQPYEETESTSTQIAAPAEKSKTKFGFLKGTSRTSKTTKKAYTVTSEQFVGDLDTTDRNRDLENIPFDREFNIPAYSPKKIVAEIHEKPVVEEEKRRYRLIARFRHEGDEDEVDKEKIRPESYGFASTAYDGPLDETSRQEELDQTPIGEHTTVYHHGRSWIKDEPVPAPIVEEKKQKNAVVHVKSPKKEKVIEPIEPETHEVRLIARIRTEEPESTSTAAPAEKSKKRDTSSSSKFGFFKGPSRTTKTTATAYPVTSEQFVGDLDTTDRNQDLENIPFDREFNIPAYSPKKIVAETHSHEKPVVEEEKRRYRLIARFRHEGDEDEVDKEKIRPESYGFASTAYDGPLDETSRQEELDQTPIGEHTTVYHHGRSWIKDEPVPAPIVEEKKQKKAVVHVKSPKKEKVVEPIEPETHEVRLIARIRTEEPESTSTPVAAPAEKSKKRDTSSSSKFGFFKGPSRTTKTTEKAYPATSEQFVGHLDTTDRSQDLENIPFDREFNIPAYSPKKIVAEIHEKPVVEEEKRRYRLIARFRHEGDEDEVDKEKIRPESYGFASTAYDGPLDETSRQEELDQTPIGEHTTVYHHGRSWIKDEPIPAPIVEEKKQKKAVVHVKSPKKEKVVEPIEPETHEVRLIARIRTEEPESTSTPVAAPAEKSKKRDTSSSSKFGFFKGPSRTTKTTTKTTATAYPVTSEQFVGDLDTTDRNRDLENIPFDREFNIPAYSPKKIVAEIHEKPVVEEEKRRYRLIARFRHEGDEDEIDKEKIRPESYGFASTAYDGPLDETSRQEELDQTPIGEHTTVYHHGRSWIKDEPIPAPIVEEKKQKKAVVHVKSPKKEKVVEPIEPETHEVRLIARIRTEEPESTSTAVPAEKSKKRDTSSSSKFGFFKGPSRTTKTATKTTEIAYPVTSEQFVGDLDTTDRNQDLENIPFDREFNIPAYSPKKIVAETHSHEKPVVEEEKRRYRLIARFRHEGDEDEVDKEKIRPESYGFASTAYDGPLDETSRQEELDQTPIGEHTTVYHHGRSWIKDEPIPAPIVEEKKQKKAVVHVKSPKKEKVVEPIEPETHEVRLIARIRTEEPESTSTPVAAPAEKSKKRDTSSSSKFGFFKGPSRTTKTTTKTTATAYPVTSEQFVGDLDTTDRNRDLENIPFDREFNIPAYSPKKIVAETHSHEKPVVEEEKRRYRLIARFRHEGDEDEVDKERIRPESYGFASTAYDGPLDETSRQEELDQTPIGEHTTVYHHGRSWIKDEPVPAPIVEEKKQKKAVVHVKSPKKEKVIEPIEPETHEVRLIARIRTEEPESTSTPVAAPAEKSKKRDTSSSSKFGFFKGPSRTTKTTEKAYPATSEQFVGHLDTTDRNRDLENIPFDREFNIPAYSPKKIVAEIHEKPVVEEEKRRYRLIARFRHEGDEDEVDKEKIRPESYGFASTAYDGPLDETSRQEELDQTPIGEHTTVYHHGRSWIKDEPIPAPIVEEKKQKKAVVHVKSPKKEKVVEPIEPETHEVRLIARIRTEEPESTSTPVAAPAEKTKKRDTSSSSKFGFFKGPSRTTKTTEKAYPATSEQFVGHLDTTDRSQDLENIPFDREFNIPAYSPKKIVAEIHEKPVVEEEKRRYRLIARFRHEGDEDEVDKEKIRPESYGFASTAYDGPLDETSRQEELDQTPIGEHTTVYHHGRSWIKDEPIPAPIVEEKKQKKAVVHVKSPKKEKVIEPIEPETHEVRLIARIRTEEPETSVAAVPAEKSKKRDTSSSSKFGFFKGPSRTTKTTTKTTATAYPVTSEQFVGDLDTTDRNRDLENIPFDREFSIPAYSPKKIVAETHEKPVVEEEKRRYRLIARFRHEGDEDEIDKEKIRPESYGFASTAYDGPLNETSRQEELDQTPIGEHTTVYHHGRSWIKDEPIPAPIVEEKKQKKAVVHVKSPKKEKVIEPIEPETHEVRLIARIRTEEPESTSTPVAAPAEKSKKRDTSSSSKFGFFKGPSRTTKTTTKTTATAYPVTSEQFVGDLDTTDRNRDLENIPFDREFNIAAYSPKKIVAETHEKPVVEEEKRRYRLIARFRHEGDEDEIDKEKIRPESYGFASTAYDGPLNETSPQEELDQTPIGEHTTVYHHGRSWIKDEPIPAPIVEEKKQKKAVVHVKSPKKEKVIEPIEPETHEVRLIARIRTEEPESTSTPVAAPAEKSKKRDTSSSSKFGFFKGPSRTTKTTTKTTATAYPVTSEQFVGDLDTTDRNRDLENIPFDREFNIAAYSPKKIVAETHEKPVVEEEKRRYRLIARFRHEGDEDEIDKEKIRPESYGFASTAYDGPLNETSRQEELDQTPIGEHTTVYHHGRSWIKDEPIPAPIVEEKKQKKAVVHVKSPKKEKVIEPIEPETHEVRLIARIRTEEPESTSTPVAAPAEKSKKRDTSSSSKFGFFKGPSRTTKTTETSYPATSEQFVGDLDTTDRNRDLENIPFDREFNIPAYSPKKIVAEIHEKPVVEEEKRRYRLIARFRHEGDEDEVDKEKIRPESYGFASTAYDGPLDETSRQEELDQTPIGEHSTVYHHGRSWIKDEPIPAPIVEEKKQKKAVVHVKSPKMEKVIEPIEPETHEVRLIARIRTEEPESTSTPVAAPAENSKKRDTSSSSKFGFFKGPSRTTKTTTKTTATAYPVTSEQFVGDLDTTDRNRDLENIPFDREFSIPAYSPKKIVAETHEKPVVEEEKRRYRLIARFRHEGDEDEVDKEKIRPESYGFASTAYDGPLDETSRQEELDQTPIGEHTTVYHHGRSWIKDEPIPAPIVEEKKQKKAVVHVKSPKKEKVVEPIEPETHEVRLIARIRTEEPESTSTPVAAPAEKTKKRDTSSSSKFGFFKGPSRTTKTTEKAYPATSEQFVGHLDTTDRSQDLENIPFDREFNIPAYSPKKIVAEIHEKPVVEEEKRRYRLIARFRHEGDEDEVDKEKIRPESYGFASTAYDGPLDETSRQEELDQTPIGEHTTVYHHGRSWIKDEPIPAPIVEEKKQKKAVVHVKSPKKEKVIEPNEPETHEVRLIARVRTEEPESTSTAAPAEKSKKRNTSSSSKFGFFKGPSRTTKTTETAYPATSEQFVGDLDTTDRNRDLENIPFDREFNIPAYSPKKIVAETQPTVEEEKRRYRLIARFRHEGDEDEVDKEKIRPESYGFASTAYDGPLDETSRQEELDQTPIGEHSTVYHHGISWIKDEPIPAPIVEEKKQKKAVVHVKSPKKEKVIEPNEPETHEVRLIARVRTEEPESTSTPVAAPAEKSKKRDTSSSSKFGFFKGPSRTTKTTETSYPATSEQFVGDLDTTDRNRDLENIPFDREFNIPAYSPKKIVAEIHEKPVVEEEKRRYRLIARFRHEGDEDEVDKEKIRPESYGFASTAYDGPLGETSRQEELDQTPIGEHTTVYHHGRSWIKDEPIPAPIVEEKKQKKAVVHVKSPKKEKVVESIEPETHEVRLIARVRTEEPESTSTPVAAPAEKSKKRDTSSSSKFGFFKGPSRTTKTTEKAYPATSEQFVGDLDTTDRSQDLENIPFDHKFNIPAYSPGKIVPDAYQKPTVKEEKRRYRLIARFRHEGDEDEVDKEKIRPESYGFASTAYDGPLDETNRQEELDQTPIGEHTTVYHHGRSWIKDEPIPAPIVEEKKKEKRSVLKEKSVNVVETEKPDARLIARVLPMKKESFSDPSGKDSKSRGITFWRSSPSRDSYPRTDPYSGDLETIRRSEELEPRQLTDNIGPSTSTTHHSTLVVESTVNYFPSSLQYDPRPARIEGYTENGHGYAEIHIDRRVEVQIEPVYVLREITQRSHAYPSTSTAYFSGAPQPFIGSVSEDEAGIFFTSTPPMSPPERGLLARLGFKRDKNKKKDKKKGKKENDSSETSDSEHDEKREFAVVEFQPHDQEPQQKPQNPTSSTTSTPRHRLRDDPMNEVTVLVTGGQLPAELGQTKVVREEKRENQFRLTGDGFSSGFNPNDPSLMATIQRAERLNASSPRLEHAERTFTVRANAPLPVSFEESGQPYTTVSTWQEASDLPEQVEVFTNENGRQVTRTVKSSQVKHTVQTQSFQNYIVDGDQVPVGVVDVERSREQLTPVGQQGSSTNGNGIVETQTRTMTYESQGGENSVAPPGWADQGLGEYVSSKSVTQGNRTIETITYKTEKDGIIETHVEHRVTIHSDGDIDHDAELSQAIMEATQMNPDMVVEKIEVRQESTQ